MDQKDQDIETLVDRATAIFLLFGFFCIGIIIGVSL